MEQNEKITRRGVRACVSSLNRVEREVVFSVSVAPPFFSGFPYSPCCVARPGSKETVLPVVDSATARYTYNTDKDMVQLKFVSTGGQPLGVINWYAVHCTSMNNTNSYISSDNKGYAGLLFEGAVNGPEIMPGEVRFNIIFTCVCFIIQFIIHARCNRVRL